MPRFDAAAHAHAQALQAQAVTHQQALADLVKQHQEVCGRLAAAATAEADMKQQMQRFDADRRAWQQQVEKVRDAPGCHSRASGAWGGPLRKTCGAMLQPRLCWLPLNACVSEPGKLFFGPS